MPIRAQLPDGRIIEAPDDTSPEELDALVNAESGESSPEEPGLLRRAAETAIDYAPTIGGIAGGTAGLLTGPAAPIVSPVLAGLGGAAGSAVQQLAETLTGERGETGQLQQVREMAGAGAEQGIGQLGGQVAGAGTRLLARPLMRMALGAQTAVRNKFPTVDLERVALREGTNPRAVRQLSNQSGQAVSAAGRAADAAGAPPIQPREVIRGLRKIYDKAGQARMPDDQQQVVEMANQLRKQFRGGVNVEDALVAKSARQARAKSVMQGAADPRSAATSQKIEGAVAKDLAAAARNRSPEVGQALNRSQELMALERALKNKDWMPTRTGAALAGVASGATGFGTGDPASGVGAGMVPLMLSSPRAGMVGARAVAQSAPALREATRLAILKLLGEEGDQNDDQ